jgi:branched-chain amino acid transport system substrate-binding protein
MKRLLSGVLILCVAFFMAGGAASAAEPQPKVFKVGFITGISGPFAQVADTQVKAVTLLVEQINAAGGLAMPWGKIPVELIVKDDEVKIDVGVRRFRELVDAGVHGVSGGVYNPMSAAFNEECKISGTPYVPACVPAIDAFKKGVPAPATYSVAFTPWSIGWLAGDALINGMKKKTIFWQGRPDSWGTTMLAGLKDACKEFGGTIVATEELPSGTPDYSAVINKALAAKADVFVTNMFGGDAVACIKQAYDMGLHKVSTLFNTWTFYDVAMGIPEAALENFYALTYYYYDLENFNKGLADRGRTMIEAHVKKYGRPPDAYAVLAYNAVDVIFQSAVKAGSVDPAKMAKVMASSKFDTLKGEISFREDHQLTGSYQAFAVKGKKPSERKDKYDCFTVTGAYGGDKALPPLQMLGY